MAPDYSLKMHAGGTGRALSTLDVPDLDSEVENMGECSRRLSLQSRELGSSLASGIFRVLGALE